MQQIGVVFPGQGSQSIGMLADIAQEFPNVKKTFTTASQVLGYDLWDLVTHGPEEVLNQTIHTQPALLAAAYAIWQIIQESSQPALLAGHSLGEYTALVCANAISFEEGIQLVAHRGQYMQEAVPVGIGALAAIIGLDNADVEQLCVEACLDNEILSPANFNSPGQIVIAGYTQAVERAIVLAKSKGARLAKLLPVSVPSHCDLMKPAALRLEQLLTTMTIQTPEIPVISNVDGSIYQNPQQIRMGLVKQLYSPVQWVKVIETMTAAGINHIIECGPNKVLSGLNKRIVPEASLANTADLASLRNLLDKTEVRS